MQSDSGEDKSDSDDDRSHGEKRKEAPPAKGEQSGQGAGAKAPRLAKRRVGGRCDGTANVDNWALQGLPDEPTRKLPAAACVDTGPVEYSRPEAPAGGPIFESDGSSEISCGHASR
jgi:hypothetical protein